jgi:hypothetical protein
MLKTQMLNMKKMNLSELFIAKGATAA